MATKCGVFGPIPGTVWFNVFEQVRRREGSAEEGAALNWFTLYAVMGVLVSMTCFIVSDRHRSNATSVALAAGLLWPLVILGGLQLGLVMLARNLSRDPVRLSPVSSIPPL